MSVTVYASMVALGLVLMLIALNHAQARIAVVELMLNEGLPPGHQAKATSGSEAVLDPGSVLEPGLHLFVSRTCYACQRLMEELTGIDNADHLPKPLFVEYVDRPRLVAGAAVERLGATLRDHQHELASGLAADPLPYAIVLGPHGLVARGVAPTSNDIIRLAHDGGLAGSPERTTT